MADRAAASFIDAIYGTDRGRVLSVSRQTQKMSNNSAEVVCKVGMSGIERLMTRWDFGLDVAKNLAICRAGAGGWDRIAWFRAGHPSPRKGEGDD